MTRLFAVIRHGPTEWNEVSRIQGRTDIPLSNKGRDTIREKTLPSFLLRADWLTSPLIRAQETGKLLDIQNITIDERLIETNWGDWEGETLANLRAQYGEEMLKNEERGLDLTPPRGESPRQVVQRLKPLLMEIGNGAEDKTVGAVTHKGVIRSLLSLATDWDMRGKPPIRLDWESVHIFMIDHRGEAKPHKLNIKLNKR